MGGFLSSRSTAATSESSGVVQFHFPELWQFHFNQIKDSSHLVVIDFSATWCGPCRFMEPVIKEMAGMFTNVEFVKIDVDELSDVAQEFKVQAMPTFLFVKKGKEVDRLVGAKKEDLLNKIHKYQ
ncbi:hypothetical protein VNO78_15066 [Psophocarpus tetragonolobus]|uniref:Thioredoxin domain-containing protein n=1 Tax=Psophocarpus tetragonolobus TaxID=3891 RepID=A0AAN9SE91_PSOTE